MARSNGPLYRQLADILREPIGNGTFPVGGELPKEATIAEHFGVSLITVRQALRDLEADGLIRKRSAKPAVVAARNPSVNLSWKFKNFADMAAFTKDAQLTVKSYRKEISPVLQRHFGMGKDEAGYCLRSVLSIGEQRKAQITTYFPPDIGARLKREDFSDVLIFRSVQKHLGLRLDVAHVTVRAEIADEAVAADLGIATGQPGADGGDALPVGGPAQHRVLRRPSPRRHLQHHLRRAERSVLRRAGEAFSDPSAG